MTEKSKIREVQRASRHRRLRKKISGTTERPRLCVHRSLKNFYAQVVDDIQGKVLFGLSTRNKDIQSKVPYGGNRKAAEVLGEVVAAKAVEMGIKKVSFDRGGYGYHGRVQAFADAARKQGIEF